MNFELTNKKIHPHDCDSPYWICCACAKDYNGVYFKISSTAADVICGYCNGENQNSDEFCFPVVDYKWKI